MRYSSTVIGTGMRYSLMSIFFVDTNQLQMFVVSRRGEIWMVFLSIICNQKRERALLFLPSSVAADFRGATTTTKRSGRKSSRKRRKQQPGASRFFPPFCTCHDILAVKPALPTASVSLLSFSSVFSHAIHISETTGDSSVQNDLFSSLSPTNCRRSEHSIER